MLPEKETLNVEFKSDIKNYSDSDIFEAVVAFANTDGGELYLGIEDDGSVSGVHGKHANPDTLSAYIANNTVPPVPVRAEIIDDTKPVLCISVPKSYSGIVATASGKVLQRRLKADGEPENVPMYPAEFATRLSDLRLLDYTAMPVPMATLDDLDIVETERLKRLIEVNNGERNLLELSDIDLFKALGLVRETDGKIKPTIAGILILGKQKALETYVPTATSVFQVLQGTEVRLNEDMRLPVLASMEKINTYLNAYNPEQEIELGLYRVSVPQYDKRAVREALVNAFSHRDYTKMGRIRVSISDEGLTIANPGGFVDGVSINNLLTAEPHGRNPLLADILKRIGLAERTGRGIDRIFMGSLLYGKALPEFKDSTAVTVNMSIPKSVPDVQLYEMIINEQKRSGHPLSLNTLLILNTLKDHPKITVNEISHKTGISEMYIKNIIENMISSGIVDHSGSEKNRNYFLSHKVYNIYEERTGYGTFNKIDESEYPDLIMRHAGENEFITRADVVSLLRVNENKAYKLLRKLADQNRLIPVNKGKYAKYRLND